MINPETQSKHNPLTARDARDLRSSSSKKTYNMRCPSCAKLYVVADAQIRSQSPHFNCEVCKVEFSFEYPPKHPNSIQTFPLRVDGRAPSFSTRGGLTFNDRHFRECPKCNHVNPKNISECRRCGVIFAKLDGLSLDQKQGAFPSLVKMWQDLMSDYGNLAKHVAFVDRCEDLQALPFALKRYQGLKEAQPHDELAQQMMHKLLLKNLGETADKMAEVSKLKLLSSKINWTRVLKLSPMAMGLVFMLTGLISLALRNLVGVGVALILLTVGLRVFKSGEFRKDDFI